MKTERNGASRLRMTAWMLAGLLLLSSCQPGRADAPDVFGKAKVVGRDPDPAETAEAETAPQWEAFPDLPAQANLSIEPAAGQNAFFLALPEDSTLPSVTLASQALLLCSGHTGETTAALLENAGFEVLTRRNFDKDPAAPDHTCAYTIARKQVLYGNEPRTLLLTAVRGTSGGEWYSNFDAAPSGSESPVFAENFLFAAEDVLLTLNEYVAAEENPLLLLCGHSRGAACANLLGLLANALYGQENVFVYTFATPATIFVSEAEETPADLPDGNIFNYLNPRDLVPQLPPAEWGCRRAGTDFILPDPAGGTDSGIGGDGSHYAGVLEALCGISPTVSAYYGERHSLTEAGLSEDGLTAHEVFLLIGSALAEAPGAGDSADGGEKKPDAPTRSRLDGLIAEESDFYPLIELLEEASADGWRKGTEILMQHLPAAYAELLRQFGESEEENGYGIH